MEAGQHRAPEGWLGLGRGSHSWKDPRELGGSAGSMPSISAAQSGPGKPAGLLGRVLGPPRPLPGGVGPRGAGERWGRRGEVGGRGPPRPEDQGRRRGCFPHPLGPWEACWAPTWSSALQGPLWLWGS